jgi:hypothetical protein
MIITVLHVIALVSFLIALADWPPLPALRCVAFGLAMLALAQLVGVGR